MRGAKDHPTARGNGRVAAFLCPDDHGRFLEQLDAALDADGVVRYAYVLVVEWWGGNQAGANEFLGLTLGAWQF